jgi:hypothetical protein
MNAPSLTDTRFSDGKRAKDLHPQVARHFDGVKEAMMDHDPGAGGVMRPCARACARTGLESTRSADDARHPPSTTSYYARALAGMSLVLLSFSVCPRVGAVDTIFVVGGRNITGGQPIAQNAAFFYNVAANTWSTAPNRPPALPPPAAYSSRTFAAAGAGCVYLVYPKTIFQASPQVHVLDVASGTWTTLSFLPFTMVRISDPAAIVFANGTCARARDAWHAMAHRLIDVDVAPPSRSRACLSLGRKR